MILDVLRNDFDPEENGREPSAAKLELPTPDELQMFGGLMQHQLLETLAQPSASSSSPET